MTWRSVRHVEKFDPTNPNAKQHSYLGEKGVQVFTLYCLLCYSMSQFGSLQLHCCQPTS